MQTIKRKESKYTAEESQVIMTEQRKKAEKNYKNNCKQMKQH